MLSRSSASPFGPETQKYWDRREEYFSRFAEGIQTDAEGLYSVMPEDAALAQGVRLRSEHVLDAFAGIGGNAIGFARAGKKVTAIDTDVTRLQMAQVNARIYGVDDRITFIQGDCRDYFKTVPQGAVYLDPPWGGPDYKGQGAFLLRYFTPDGKELLDEVLPLFDEVMLRVPRTFDLTELEGIPYPFEVSDDLSLGRLVSRSVLFRAGGQG